MHHHPGATPWIGRPALLPAEPRLRAVLLAAMLALPALGLLVAGLAALAVEQAFGEPTPEYELVLRSAEAGAPPESFLARPHAVLHPHSVLELTLRPVALSAVRPVVQTWLIHDGQKQVLSLPLKPGPDASYVLRAPLDALPQLPSGISILAIKVYRSPRPGFLPAALRALAAYVLPATPNHSREIYGVLELEASR